jgi:hypothetical protein
MAKATYVRLSPAAQHGVQVHLPSGWGISGRDVRQVPESKEVQTYIRKQIQRGVFEEASKAEWDEVHAADDEDDDDTPRVIMVADRAVPENKLRYRLDKKAARLEAQRAARAAGESNDDDDDGDSEDDSVDGLTVNQLREELKRLDLPTSGNKDELVSRLTEALDEGEDEGDDGE